jgi:hypothetical protein
VARTVVGYVEEDNAYVLVGGMGKRTQTLKLRFLYVTDSTLNPMVGIVVTTSPIYDVVLALLAPFESRHA